MSLNINDRVVCTEHLGAHEGVVAAVLAPGVGYGVAWLCRNPDFGVEGAPRQLEPQYPADFLAVHRGDLVWCDAAKVEKIHPDARHCDGCEQLFVPDPFDDPELCGFCLEADAADDE